MMTENPYALFDRWFAEARDSEPNDANAMTLATADDKGRPSARIVLLKEYERKLAPWGGFVFYTNSQSRKGGELAHGAPAALLFHWKSLQRQVRVEGPVKPVHSDQADAYFATRPRISQLGAWASDQSRPLDSRSTLEERLADVEARFEGKDVPRPPHWWGYMLEPEAFEFWRAGEFRLHDRLVFARAGTPGEWREGRLFP